MPPIVQGPSFFAQQVVGGEKLARVMLAELNLSSISALTGRDKVGNIEASSFPSAQGIKSEPLE